MRFFEERAIFFLWVFLLLFRLHPLLLAHSSERLCMEFFPVLTLNTHHHHKSSLCHHLDLISSHTPRKTFRVLSTSLLSSWCVYFISIHYTPFYLRPQSPNHATLPLSTLSGFVYDRTFHSITLSPFSLSSSSTNQLSFFNSCSDHISASGLDYMWSIRKQYVFQMFFHLPRVQKSDTTYGFVSKNSPFLDIWVGID